MKKYPFQDLPEGLANIEVEKGETLITPDGRTYSFPTGRKHSKGGIKILAEPGSWVASAYQKFDRGVAKKLMPLEKLNAKKGKKIPVADISKKYDTTNYFEMLENKDGRLDELRASTSQYMIAKYSAHQGNILKAQEEMKRDKGLDHDLDELDDNPNQGMMMAKMGGKLNSRKYKSGGVAPGTRNGQTKKSWRKGKKMAVWMDGSWHHFGDSSMQDFRTHKSDKRKKAYYDRHKKNLQGDSSRAKAFRAYSRKTWQNGGEIDTIPAPIILPVENYDNRATPYLENWERYAPELPDNVYKRRFARPRPSQEYIDSLQSLPKQRTIIDLRPMAPPKPVIRVPMPDTTRVPEPLMRGGGYMDMYQKGGYKDRDTIVPPNIMPVDTVPPKPFYDDSYKNYAPERPPMPPNPRTQPRLQNDEDFRIYRDSLHRFSKDSTKNRQPIIVPSVPSVPSVPGPMPLKYGGEIPKYQNAGNYPGYEPFRNFTGKTAPTDLSYYLPGQTPFPLAYNYLPPTQDEYNSWMLSQGNPMYSAMPEFSPRGRSTTPSAYVARDPSGRLISFDPRYRNRFFISTSGVPTLLDPSTPSSIPPSVGSTGTPSGVSSASSTSSASSVPSYTGPSTTDPARLARNKAFRKKYGIENTPYNPTDDPNWVAYEPGSKTPSAYYYPPDSGSEVSPHIGTRRIYKGLLDLPLNKGIKLSGKLADTGRFWWYKGWPEVPHDPDEIQSWQKEGDDTYGVEKELRDKHIEMYTHIHGEPPRNSKEFLDWYDKSTGRVWDTDEDKGKAKSEREISKYGDRAFYLPSKSSFVKSDTWGGVNLTDWRKNPEAVLDRLPLVNKSNRDQVRADIDRGFSVPLMSDLHLRRDYKYEPIPSLGPDPLVSNEPLETIELPDSDKSRIEKEKKKIKDKLKKEVPVGTDPEKLLYNLKQGLLAAQLAGLERDLPYYAYSPIKAVVNRFDPVNTKAAERMFNMSSEALRNSNLPEAVKQARLSDMGANLAKSVAQTGMQNYQGSLQNRNLVAQRVRDVLNRNIQAREQANKQYFMEDAQGKFMTQKTRQNLMENMFKNTNARLAALRGRELISQLGDNYVIDPAGNLVFLKGKGVKPQYDQLDVFGGDMSWINDIPYGELQALRKKHSKGTA